MRQTTLFDFNVEKVKLKRISCELDNNNYPAIQNVVYKPTKLDSDNIDGFDSSLQNWIYPTNYPVRDYQLQIVQQCLYKNTLVCLPTGLGKTFIATVTMYNFYRWYPSKKIVFVAPTRPLVRQQMVSTSDCVPIDVRDIVEMTGSIAQTARLSLWQDKRVFFLTAQVFVNDLACGMCPTSDVVMVVFDEAHKATGNHSYCQAIRLLSLGSRLFRVLGLSATPGNDIATIQSVIQNLLISHIELRTDECKDIKAYSHERLIDEIVVPLGAEVTAIRDRLYNICVPLIDRLKNAGALNQNVLPHSLSKFGLLTQKDEFKSSCRNISQYVFSDFAVLISLYHAIELVQQHGLRPLFHFLSNAMTTNNNIKDIITNHDFMSVVKDLEHTFESDHFVGGHPKLEKLKVIVKEHFEKHMKTNNGDKSCQTRVMVFSQFRDSVNEILKLLEQLKPLVRPMGFVGRSKNVSQKEQMDAMRLFINGTVNVLVSTCIGEEGLDVGEVDLIVCFDAQRSPIRLVQRLGRTGRKREGRIVILLSEGKEVSSYRSSIRKKSKIHSAIFEGYKHLSFYPDNPRLVPIGLDPTVTFQKHKLQERVLSITPTIQRSTVDKVVYPSQILKISIEPESLGHMRFLCEENSERSTFTQRYNAHKHRHSLHQAQKTFRIGHSRLTESTVSILKLKEMHSRGKTSMIFHLNNSRHLDIEEPMSQVEELSTSQHSLESFSICISEKDDDGEKSRVKPALSREEFSKMLIGMEFSEFTKDVIWSDEDSWEKEVPEETGTDVMSEMKCPPSASAIPICTERKESLLKSFNRNLGGNGDIFQSCSTPFMLQTSTPISVRKKQNLLNSFHNSARKSPQIGLDSAMLILDASVSLGQQISTDLFDDNDFLFDDTENDTIANDLSTKGRQKSTILRSFHVGPLKGLNSEMDSDFADIFTQQKEPGNAKIPVESDEDLFSENDQQWSDVDQPQGEENGSEDSVNFLQMRCSAPVNRLSDHSPSFETDSSQDEKDLSKSPSFGSTTEEEHVDVVSKKRPRHLNDFFLSQADVSDHRGEEDLDGSFLDQMEASFIDDNVLEQQPDTQMEQIYARSLQSPLNYHKHRREDTVKRKKYFIDTQLPVDEDYMYDSFVVPDDFKSPARKRPAMKRKEVSHLPEKRFRRLEILEDSFVE